MFRYARDFLMAPDSGVPLLICENDTLDTTTARGRNHFGKLMLDADMETELCGERARRALVVAKRRGKKLGTHHRKAKGRGTNAIRKKALDLARRLAKHSTPLKKKSWGARQITSKLNELPAAVKANGKTFHVSKVQRLLANQKLLALP